MFPLLRYFSITSLIAFIVVVVLLAALYREAAVNDLLVLREENNVALTQAFANSLWPEFEDFVNSASELSVEELHQHPETARLHRAVVNHTEGLSVIKIKVYDLNALTVFSTEAAQIGEDKSGNAGYQAARAGDVASELTHRDTFSAFEQVIEDRDVISSYIPIRSGGEIEGVFEVYDDVTPLLARINLTQQNIIINMVVVLGLLYAVLFLIVRHGAGIIKQQASDRIKAEKARFELETRLQTVISSTPIMLWVVNQNKELTLLEGRGLQNWGIIQEQAIGKKIGQVYSAVPQIEYDIAHALAGKEYASILSLHDFTFDTRYIPLRNGTGEVVGVVGVATDITERVMAESALGEANRDLEKRNQQLERVHEFLNSSLENLTETIQRGTTQGEMLTYIDQIRTQFKRLS